MPTTVRKSKAKLPVSEGNLNKAALRLLTQRLVSTEMHYIQRQLGPKAKDALPVLEKELKSRFTSVRIAAASAVWHIDGRGKESIPPFRSGASRSSSPAIPTSVNNA